MAGNTGIVLAGVGAVAVGVVAGYYLLTKSSASGLTYDVYSAAGIQEFSNLASESGAENAALTLGPGAYVLDSTGKNVYTVPIPNPVTQLTIKASYGYDATMGVSGITFVTNPSPWYDTFDIYFNGAFYGVMNYVPGLVYAGIAGQYYFVDAATGVASNVVTIP